MKDFRDTGKEQLNMFYAFLLIKKITHIIFFCVLNFDFWLQTSSVETCKPKVLICRRGNFVYILRMCINVTFIIFSLKISEFL